MLTQSDRFTRVVTVVAVAAVVCGCRGREQPLTNPFASADRVPAPGTRLIQPGTATPYYPGGALPTTGAPVVAPVQPFAQPAPAFGQTPAFGQPQTFGQPQAFGQAQSPVLQAQPFAPPSVAPPTFAPQQPFAQPLPGQPITPVAPFNPGAAPQGSGARGSSSRVVPNQPAFTTAQAAPPARLEGDQTAILIPPDNQQLRPAVAQQLPPATPAGAAPSANPSFAAATPVSAPAAFIPPAPSNHVAVRIRPVSSGVPAAPFTAATPLNPATPLAATGVTQVSTSQSPEFSALPTANANLPWISGSAPRPATARLMPPSFPPVVQAGGFATLSNAAPSPRVRLPGATSGAVQVTELAP